MKKVLILMWPMLLWMYSGVQMVHAAERQVVFVPGETIGKIRDNRKSEDKMSKDGITIYCSRAAFAEKQYRCYTTSEMTITSELPIVRIEVTAFKGEVVDDMKKLPENTAKWKRKGDKGYSMSIGEENTKEIKFKISHLIWLTKIILILDESSDTPPATIAAPTISGVTPFDEQTVVDISGEEGAAMSYSLDDGITWSAYDGPMTLTETTTVQARAEKDGKVSDVATQTFTKNQKQETTTLTIGEFLSEKPEADTNMSFTNATILAVRKGASSGSGAYSSIVVQDETGAIEIVSFTMATLDEHDFKEGDIISGSATGTYYAPHGMPMVNLAKGAKLELSPRQEGKLPEPATIDSEADYDNHLNKLVKMAFVTNKADGISIYDYNRKNLKDYLLGNNVQVEVVGICRKYNGERQIAPLSDDGITVVYDENHPENAVLSRGEPISVKLVRSVGLTAGKYGTLTLPFSMTKEQMAEALGEDAVVAAFDKGTSRNINFRTVTDGMQAGVPYLVKTNKDIASLVGKASTGTAAPTAKTVPGEAYNFVGALTVASPSEGSLYVTNSGLKRLTAGGKIKPFRAYITVNSATANVRSFSIDNVPTGIVRVDGTVDAKPAMVFSLRGEYLGDSTQGLPSGIYIVNKKKVVVR